MKIVVAWEESMCQHEELRRRGERWSLCGVKQEREEKCSSLCYSRIQRSLLDDPKVAI